MIAQATSIIKGICKQPVDGEAISFEFAGTRERTYLLPYTVPLVLSSVQYRGTPDEAWTTVTGVIAYKTDGVWSLYYEGNFGIGLWRANLAVGYDGTTHAVPGDLESVCSEMVVELWKNTDFALHMQVERQHGCLHLVASGERVGNISERALEWGIT